MVILRAFFPFLTRGYATRLPQKPPIRHPDPLSNAVTTSLPEHLTFIHRPPPSPPTPFSLTVNPSSPLLRTEPPAQSTILDLPPPLKKPALTHPRLSEEAIAEMRRLRTENPSFYTCRKLADSFGCSPSFVSYIAPLKPSQQRAALAKRDREHEKARARWGEKASLIREIRRKRKEFW
ncbi:mitochondrial ribosomal protein subunit L20-domain-containing protein [Russula earlei]|uniref:Mitochondrial ribosomal protein subunit L20-domain-containing protein n=1 Tax=Russula earlei TaxID=71964 RepID=A0ACC0UGT7_9AGAM|nr:mitochondrial ribosomal protein subunit L20-domain-containing protein [Russula earlei]